MIFTLLVLAGPLAVCNIGIVLGVIGILWGLFGYGHPWGWQ